MTLPKTTITGDEIFFDFYVIPNEYQTKKSFKEHIESTGVAVKDPFIAAMGEQYCIPFAINVKTGKVRQLRVVL